ncbi:MAG TPA: PEP-CTERM sorting domain-containing protein, partial [Tepidisphaeraceae bacterium]|nr:PEP-CTERM sorting domain-containing protein [Tepidisphaeraceae bacterium]
LVNTNTLGTYLTEAKGINDSGQIIAFGWNSHSYLLTPIPEPSIVALLAALTALCFARKRF